MEATKLSVREEEKQLLYVDTKSNLFLEKAIVETVQESSGTDEGVLVAEHCDSVDNQQGQHEELCPRETGFSSENFKIEISGLPKRLGFKELKKRLTSTMGLNPHKMKAVPRQSYAFVCFRCEEERSKALDVINGHVWKGQQLKAKKAQPVKDPMKRKQEDGAGNSTDAKRFKMDEGLSPAERLRSAVTPLWDMKYSDQLQLKTECAKSVLRTIVKNGQVRDQFLQIRKEHGGMCCELLPIAPSPVLTSYRNKAEFSIGPSESGNETVVGFRFGLYKDGTVCVGDPSEIAIISPNAKVVAKSFQEYVHDSQYGVFDHKTHQGHWKQLTTRTTQGQGGTMAIAEFVVNGLTREALNAEKEVIKIYFTEGKGRSAEVTSFLFRPCTRSTTNSNTEEPYELIFGDGFIFESMLGMKFRVSPSAFFQVNTSAAERLYTLIGEWCKVSSNTTVLDICCGTGTIGLSIAKHVKQVIGIEMCHEAIADAKVNAEMNDVKNCTYQCAKVQDVIQDVIRGLTTSEDVVAILDPPRAGVDPVVIKHLRKCSKIQRIIYAACQPASAKTNFIELVRPSTKRNKGAPFKFVHAMPVDMFPYTKHYELLVLFERDVSTVGVKHEADDSD